MCMLLLGQRDLAIFKSSLQRYCSFRLVNRTQNTLFVDHHFNFVSFKVSGTIPVCFQWTDETTRQVNFCPHRHWHQKECVLAEAEKTESKMGRDTELFCCRCQRVICFKNAMAANQSSNIPKQGIWEKGLWYFTESLKGRVCGVLGFEEQAVALLAIGPSNTNHIFCLRKFFICKLLGLLRIF